MSIYAVLGVFTGFKQPFPHKIQMNIVQQTFNCSKSTIETIGKGVKYVQN